MPLKRSGRETTEADRRDRSVQVERKAGNNQFRRRFGRPLP
ncbi:MAG: hypothetical protein ACD_10C00158G0003, partial [uncultured bacterium]